MVLVFEIMQIRLRKTHKYNLYIMARAERCNFKYLGFVTQGYVKTKFDTIYILKMLTQTHTGGTFCMCFTNKHIFIHGLS